MTGFGVWGTCYRYCNETVATASNSADSAVKVVPNASFLTPVQQNYNENSTFMGLPLSVSSVLLLSQGSANVALD